MTEELKQKAENWALERVGRKSMLWNAYVNAYLAGATETTQELEKENKELKKELVEKGRHLDLTEREWGKDTTKLIHYKTQLTKAKEMLRMVIDSYNHKEKFSFKKDLMKAEQFLKNDSCPDVMCEDCTKGDCRTRQLGLVGKVK